MRKYVFAALISLGVSLVFGYFCVKALKKLKFSQTISGYVTEHKDKNGTPTVGGVIFVIPSIVVYALFSRGSGANAFAAAAIFFAYAAVGFLDDFIKIKFKRNEGLTPLQKIAFQTVVAVIASVFAYRMGLCEQFFPFTENKFDLGILFIPFSVVVFLAASNCVNLTDGLDGLAATNSALYLFFTAALVVCQKSLLPSDALAESEYDNMALLCVTTAFSLAGFLAFNTKKASVFMGDTGSLALGGLIASISIFSGNVLYIPIIGITFVASGLSVIIQVAHYKRTKKRVFLMAPLHHHFQHKGHAESKIVYCYKLVTLAAGLASLIRYIGG